MQAFFEYRRPVTLEADLAEAVPDADVHVVAAGDATRAAAAVRVAVVAGRALATARPAVPLPTHAVTRVLQTAPKTRVGNRLNYHNQSSV